MIVSKRIVKGELRWVLDTGEASGMKRKRMVFASKTKADAELSRIKLETGQLGGDWLMLTEDERLDATRALLVARRKGVTLLEMANGYVSKSSPSSTLSEAFAAFLRAKESSGSRKAYTTHLRMIVGTFIKGREEQRMNEITPAMVREFLSPTRYKPATLQGMRRRLATWFAWCVKNQLCSIDPMKHVDGITVRHSAPGILTVEECEKLFRAAEQTDRGMIPWLALGLFCGIRSEEIRRLTWENVKIDRGFVEISGEASKVRTRRLVQLLPSATEWLKLGGDLPPVNFWRRIYKLRTTAGITEWPCDVLRHTAASMMICHYKDAQRTALELGNSADVLFRHYRELVTVQDAERFYKMAPSPELLVAKNQAA